MTSAARLTKDYLLSLKAKQLQQLAASIGARSTGTKDVLAAELHEAIATPKIRDPKTTAGKNASFKDHRLLSIDMGIRNLAYCTISLPPSWCDPLSAIKPPNPTAVKASLPRMSAWTRQAVTDFSADISSLNQSEEDLSKEDAVKESYHPRDLAAHANALVQRLVIDPPPEAGPPPSTVLIERQRFRTMGASAVQEWTLRVNTFEGMLWAVLLAAKARGDWAGEVCSVLPANTARWWDGEAGASVEKTDSSSTKSTKSASKRAVKQRRIARVAQWLRAEAILAEGPAAATAQAYLGRMRAKRSLQTAAIAGEPAAKPLGKLDDLADCLLQGLAWVRWEQNRRAIVRDGDAAVQDLAAHGHLSGQRQTALARVLDLAPEVG